MYKVLLVDDERMILEGISRVMDWAAYGTELAGTARNGVEALDFIAERSPDIVVTDIRMPGLDGIELIAKVRELELPTRFIVLSGFGEFDYARSAMQYGVKHYLLKPSGEESIGRALADVVGELDRLRNKDRVMARIELEYKNMIPHAREHILKEFVMNKTYGKADWERYRGLFESYGAVDTVGAVDAARAGAPGRVRLALFQPEGRAEFEHLFALKNIAEDVLGSDVRPIGTTIGSRVLLLVPVAGEERELAEKLETVKTVFGEFYKMDVTIALSDAGDVTDARAMYREALEILSHRFYLGEGSVMTRRDVEGPRIADDGARADDDGASGDGDGYEPDVGLDEDRLALLVRSGRADDAEAMICEYFDRLTALRLAADLAKTYAMSLFLVVVRQDPSRLAAHMERFAAGLGETITLQALRDFVASTARSIALRQYEANKRKHSSIIRKVLDIVESNLHHPGLTLNGVANDMLFMNADYLGKLFKKEVGDKFSNYVTKARIEKAIELIMQSDDVKVFELAEQVGFGDNPQYFSKVFKKHTGCTPSEFKRAP